MFARETPLRTVTNDEDARTPTPLKSALKRGAERRAGGRDARAAMDRCVEGED